MLVSISCARPDGADASPDKAGSTPEASISALASCNSWNWPATSPGASTNSNRLPGMTSM